MSKEILTEIKELKAALAILIGTADLPVEQQFSKEALEKATKQFRKLSIERGEWIPESDIKKIIKTAPYNCGKFIREHFSFTNCYKWGQTFYYHKKGIIALGNELKERNVHLARYMEYTESQAKFLQKKNEALLTKSPKKGKKPFSIPRHAKNINTTPRTPPSTDVVKMDIAKLKAEFKTDNLQEYIDVYRDSYAMFKHHYYFDKYLEPTIRKQCSKWCQSFNDAHHTLEMIRTNTADY